MRWFKNISIGNKINVIVGVVLLVSFVTIFSIILTQVYKNQKSDAEGLGKEVAGFHANDIAKDFSEIQKVLFGLRGALINDKSYNAANREQAIDLLKNSLEENDFALTIYTVWKPNAYDNRDIEYINKMGSDSIGRFSPCLVKANGSTSLQTLVDYEKEGNGDFYLIPEKTKKTALIEPYYYNIGGKDTLVSSINVPIIDKNGVFVGIVGATVNLDMLQKKIEQITPMGGYSTLLSGKAIVVAHGLDRKWINTCAADIDKDWKEDASRAMKGEEVISYAKSAATGKAAMRVLSPVKLNGIDSNWSFCTVMPKSAMFSLFNAVSLTSTIVAIISFLMISVVIIFMVRIIIGPLKTATEMLGKLSEGDLRVQLENNDSKDEIGVLSRSFNAMVNKLRELILNVKGSSEMLEASSQEMSASTEQISSSGDNQSASAEETLSSMEELDASIQNISKSVQDVTSNISNVNKLIENMDKMIDNVSTSIVQVDNETINSVKATKNGKEAIEKSEQGMDIISQAVGDLVKVITGLGKSAVNIGEIVDVIDDIAEQTNLLALNAAIEAARAGEHGKGFAVVAGAIRTLAEKSGEATKEITKLIRGIQDEVVQAVDMAKEGEKEVGQGVGLAKETKKALAIIEEAVDNSAAEVKKVKILTENQQKAIKEIVEAAENINELSQTMAATVQEQTAASAEVVRAVENVSESANHIASGTSDLAVSTQSLENEAQKLSGIVAKFHV